MNPPKARWGSIKMRKVVAVSLKCMGRSRMSVPLRLNSDSERRRSTWLVNETSKALTFR